MREHEGHAASVVANFKIVGIGAGHVTTSSDDSKMLALTQVIGGEITWNVRFPTLV
jgi:hypothetical protein